jgi:hypothetical protein
MIANGRRLPGRRVSASAVRLASAALIALAAAPAPAQHTAVFTDGKKAAGVLRSISLDGRVSFRAADGVEIARPLEDVQSLELNPVQNLALAVPVELWLPAGGRLLGTITGGVERRLSFACDLGDLTLPLDSVRAIRFPKNVPEAPTAEELRRTFAEAFDRVRADKSRTEDVIFARRGDDLVELGGFLTAAAADSFSVRYQGAERRLSFAKVYAVVLSGRAAAAAAAPVLTAQITGVGGSTADLEIREMRDDHWRLIGPQGLDIRVGGARIARVELRSNKIVPLAGLPRAEVKSVTDFPGQIALAEDRNFFGEPLKLGGRTVTGLCVKPATEIKYNLAGGDFKRFAALVGIDDGSLPAGGRAAFEVLVDGAVKFKADSVAAGDKPREVAVDLAGAKVLVLRVGFAGESPAGAVAVWGDARVIRR